MDTALELLANKLTNAHLITLAVFVAKFKLERMVALTRVALFRSNCVIDMNREVETLPITLTLDTLDIAHNTHPNPPTLILQASS